MSSAQNQAPRALTAAPDDNLILDGSGYFREYTEFGLMRLNGEVLKSEGDRLFGNRYMELERNVKRLLKPRNYDWAKTDWRDVARYHIASIQGGDDSVAISLLPTVPPPADWAATEFDDTAFLRQRTGALPPVMAAWGAGRATSSFHRQGLYIRSYFEVVDPAAAGDLTVKIVYRGGVRVLINGEEIARSHLPAGEVASETYAEDYPVEAYGGNDDELTNRRPWGRWVGDLRCPYDMAPAGGTGFHVAYGGVNINRKGWDRLMGLRDRVLGPVPIPAKLLRKGANVLAIEIRTSRYHPAIVPGATAIGAPPSYQNWACDSNAYLMWDHLRLVNVELRGASRSVRSCRGRPPGLQAWVDDMHTRLFDRDFNPAGWPMGTVRFVGSQNGVFSAQIGLGTDRDLAGLKAVCGDLSGASGTRIPAGAIQAQYMIGHGLDEMSNLGWFRSMDNLGFPCAMSEVALYRYSAGANVYGELPQDVNAANLVKAKFMQNFKFFDHISPNPPPIVPANTCQPLWLTLKVPADVAPGTYKGTVTVQADGQPSLSLPVEAEVAGWRVPDPLEFQTNMESEQSPYGVAKAYKVGLWTDRHFQLIETSFRQLARLGNDWVFVPVLLNSELGNGDDGMIRWIRAKDGTVTFDYALLDRYLTLARKHLGQPRVIAFLVMHGCPSASNAVKIFDEATGRAENVEVGPTREATRKPLWRAFGASLYAHMKSLGLRDSMFWGHGFDDTLDPGLIAILADVAPGVGWTAGGHMRKPDSTFRAVAAAYGLDLTPRSMQGWKNPYMYLLMPRTGGSVICVEGICTPFTWRVMCDRAICCGMNGLGRMGADYFDRTWFSGVRSTGYNMIGRPCVQTLWPGTDGVESSARNETMLEGVQEADARIFLEQTLDRSASPGSSGGASAAGTAGRGALPEDLARDVQTVLNDHYRATLYIAAGGVDYGTMDIHGDWQGRSRRLYQTAARVARTVGLDVDKTAFGQTKVSKFAGTQDGSVVETSSGDKVTVPAMGKTRLTLKLRNWTDKPRAFKAVAGDPWIVLERAQGTVTGQQELGIVLDGRRLKDGSDVTGTLTVTDTASGAAYPVKIQAKVEKAFEYRVAQEVKFTTGGGSGASMAHEVTLKTSPVFNVPVGGSDSREYALVNNAATRLAWKIESSLDWVTTEPASGEAAPESSAPVQIVVTPRDKEGAAYDVTLTLSAANGAIKESYPIKAFVIPPYRTPAAPAGEVVYLNEVDQKRLIAYVNGGLDAKETRKPWWAGGPFYHRHGLPQGENLNDVFKWKGTEKEYVIYPYAMGKKSFTHGLWVYPRNETTYAIEGAGFSAFAAEVGFHDKFSQQFLANAGAVVCFEIYVDGKMRANSGLIKVGDPPRLLVADNLKGAKEIRLVTRRDDLTNDDGCCATWGDARFIKM